MARGLLSAPRPKRKRRGLLITGLICLAAVIAVAVAVPVVLTSRNRAASSSSSSSGGGGGGGSKSFSGTSGSAIVMEDGSKFTYQNNFGGDWTSDPQNPFGSGGKAQSWSKRVGTEQWVWGQDVARGVNLG